jgi:uncharacterized protein
MFRTVLRRALASLGLAALAGCATPAPAPAQAKPAMWQVSDEDTTIFLFGTIHLLPPGYGWRTPAFDKALEASQSLIVETIVDEANPAAMGAELGRLGFSPGQLPIVERVPPEKRAALEAAIAETGVPREAFDRMETWAAAFILLGNQFKDLGISGEAGVETALRQQFARTGKPIGQLETNAEQLGFFDSLPEPAQRSFLEGAIEETPQVREQFSQMLAAWARGDVDAIAKTFNADMGSTPEMMDTLITSRNARWTQWVSRRMASPGTTMLAVGAGHLAGDHSVVTMLQKQGFQVRRIQ